MCSPSWCLLSWGGLCSSTPRGDGNTPLYSISACTLILGLCSSTPRGDGNLLITLSIIDGPPRFMQLNPARGRKLAELSLVGIRVQVGLCSSTPRGDGNEALKIFRSPRIRFMQLNPARGRKRAPAPLSGHGATLDSHAHDDTPPCSSPVAAPHAQHISSFLMGGLW